MVDNKNIHEEHNVINYISNSNQFLTVNGEFTGSVLNLSNNNFDD